MDFEKVVEGRRSIRSFKAREVEPEKVKQILETVKYIPSAHNLQDYYIYVVKRQMLKKSLVIACLGQDFIEQAPVVFVVCADKSKEGTKRGGFYSMQSASMAAYAICLKAYELGLGSCWIGAFNDDGVKDVMQLPANLIPVAVIPVGYSSEKPRMPKRRDDFCRFLD